MDSTLFFLLCRSCRISKKFIPTFLVEKNLLKYFLFLLNFRATGCSVRCLYRVTPELYFITDSPKIEGLLASETSPPVTGWLIQNFLLPPGISNTQVSWKISLSTSSNHLNHSSTQKALQNCQVSSIGASFSTKRNVSSKQRWIEGCTESQESPIPTIDPIDSFPLARSTVSNKSAHNLGATCASFTRCSVRSGQAATIEPGVLNERSTRHRGLILATIRDSFTLPLLLNLHRATILHDMRDQSIR